MVFVNKGLPIEMGISSGYCHHFFDWQIELSELNRIVCFNCPIPGV